MGETQPNVSLTPIDQVELSASSGRWCEIPAKTFEAPRWTLKTFGGSDCEQARSLNNAKNIFGGVLHKAILAIAFSLSSQNFHKQ